MCVSGCGGGGGHGEGGGGAGAAGRLPGPQDGHPATPPQQEPSQGGTHQDGTW